jgi:hypothetical protein
MKIHLDTFPSFYWPKLVKQIPYESVYIQCQRSGTMPKIAVQGFECCIAMEVGHPQENWLYTFHLNSPWALSVQERLLTLRGILTTEVTSIQIFLNHGLCGFPYQYKVYSDSHGPYGRILLQLEHKDTKDHPFGVFTLPQTTFSELRYKEDVACLTHLS